MSRPIPAVDLAEQTARRLSVAQRRVLAEAAVGNLRRDRFAATGRAFVHGRYTRSAVTQTAKSLARLELVDVPRPNALRPAGQRDPSYTLTDLGRAVLANLDGAR